MKWIRSSSGSQLIDTIKQDGVACGVVDAVLAPPRAAPALVTDCPIEIKRDEVLPPGVGR